MTDPAQVAERPPVPGDAGPGHRWVARPDRDWSTHPDELIGRRCRFMENRRGHGVPAVAVLFRGSTTGPRPYGYCAKHLYGRWIEDGVVTQWVLEPSATPTPDPDHGAVDALYAAAEAATPGPWCLYRYERGGGRLYKHPAKLIADLYDEADREYLLLASPDRVRALIDRLRAVEAAAQAVMDEWDELGPTGTSVTVGVFGALRAALRSRP